MAPSAPVDPITPTRNPDPVGIVEASRTQDLAHAMLQAVLDGDHELARALAEQLRAVQAAPLRSVK